MNEETNSKLNTLSLVASALQREKCFFALGGEAMLYLRGILDSFEGLQFLVSPRDADKADAALCALERAGALPAGSRAKRYLINGVAVEMTTEPVFRRNGREHRFRLEKADAQDTIPVKGVPIPLHALRVWRGFCQLSGDLETLRRIDLSSGHREEKALVRYLRETYAPEAILLYGSYADGGQRPGSDFDALVLTVDTDTTDNRVLLGIPLDVEVRPARSFLPGRFTPEWMRYYGGRVVLDDEKGTGRSILEAVEDAANHMPLLTGIEKYALLEKYAFLLRGAFREGVRARYDLYRLLVETLETRFIIENEYYPGCQKALRLFETRDPAGFDLYSQALESADEHSVQRWIRYLTKRLEKAEAGKNTPPPRKRRAKKAAQANGRTHITEGENK